MAIEGKGNIMNWLSRAGVGSDVTEDIQDRLSQLSTELAGIRNELSLKDADEFRSEIGKLDDARTAIQDACTSLANRD